MISKLYYITSILLIKINLLGLLGPGVPPVVGALVEGEEGVPVDGVAPLRLDVLPEELGRLGAEEGPEGFSRLPPVPGPRPALRDGQGETAEPGIQGTGGAERD